MDVKRSYCRVDTWMKCNFNARISCRRRSDLIHVLWAKLEWSSCVWSWGMNLHLHKVLHAYSVKRISYLNSTFIKQLALGFVTLISWSLIVLVKRSRKRNQLVACKSSAQNLTKKRVFELSPAGLWCSSCVATALFLCMPLWLRYVLVSQSLLSWKLHIPLHAG